MSIRSALRLLEAADTITRPPRPLVGSPWSDTPLLPVLWNELWPGAAALLPPTRAEAMQVAAVARARHLLAGTLGRAPLTVFRGDLRLDPPPPWCQRTDGRLPPFHRLSWTVDDLLFHGESLWSVRRGADGYPLTADRVPYTRWDVDADTGAITVDEQAVPAELVIYIPGPHEGILDFGRRTIRAAGSLERAAGDTAEHPFRLELHQTTDDQLTADEISDLITEARKALADNRGILFTNSALQAIVHNVSAEQLLIEGRNAAAVDVARSAGLPAALLDANTAGASLTYETQRGRNQQFVDYGLAMYAAALTSRLSMDDVVPTGQRTALDLSELTLPTMTPTGPATVD